MDISVVVPVYNEEDSLNELFERLSKNLDSIGKKWEVIFVDDGSKDNSFEILMKLFQSDKRIKVIKLRKNFGKSYALKAGFDNARGKIIITLDADLQDDPAEVPHLLEELDKGYDLVNGWKYPRKDNWITVFFSWIFNKIIYFFSGLPLHDINCGLKVFRRSIIEEIVLYGELHRFIPLLAWRRGFKVTERKVKHHPRQFGTSKFNWTKVIRGLLDFITISFFLGSTYCPSHLFSITGLFIFILGGGIVGYLELRKILFNIYIAERPLFILAVFLMIAGIQLVFTGFLGELIVLVTESPARDYSIEKELYHHENT